MTEVKLRQRTPEECDMYYATKIVEMANKHDARVTELLEANNREVERRRQAEESLEELRGYNSLVSPWALRNGDAIQALIEGRAAVVPLEATAEKGAKAAIVKMFVTATRLDKPMGDK